jgi:glycosyltransferase involved in cell wall biosynthesis
MIKIFQRHCLFSSNSEHKQRPSWFDREKMFDSFVKGLDSRVELTCMFDSSRGEVDQHFLAKKDIKVVSLKGGNDAISFLNVLNYVKDQNCDPNDIIYFLEDDYIHRDGWIDVLQEGFDKIGADYFTLYDHPDKYFLPMYEDLTSKIIVTSNAHWRTVPSTTNTYACRYSTLIKHFDIHVKHCDLVDKWTKDHDKFIELWNSGSNLISCIPGYSAHVEAGMLSPLIDWSAI